MRFFVLLPAAALIASAGFCQVPSNFELTLPDFNKTISGGNVVVDIPPKPITHLTVQLLGSADKNLNYKDIRVRINGIGVGNMFNQGSNDRGKFLNMDPNTLRMRRDPIFDPRENTIEVYGKDPRGRSYYQNWVLRNGAENTNPYFTYVSSLVPTDEAGVPPDINLESPAMPLTGSNKPIPFTLKGEASAASGIASLTFNGVPARAAKGISVPFNENVTVPAGAKSVVVEAVDGKGNKRSITIPITYPATAPPPKLAGKNWAIIIGVSKFTAKALPPPPLPIASFDAQELAESLKARGFAPDHVTVLLDEKATLEQMRNALSDVANKAAPEDFLLVYVATQGLHDPALPEKVYITASDTQGTKLAETALEISDVQLLLNRNVRSRHTLFFFDAEHELPGDWAFQGKSIVNGLLLGLFDGPMGRSVLVSGAADQTSMESAAEAGHAARSVFSVALLDALAGKADVDHNRVLTAKEICTYVAERVREQTGGKQSPQFRYPESESEVPVLQLK